MTTLKHFISTTLIAAALAFAAGCENIALDSANNIGAFNHGEFQGLYNDVKAPVVSEAAREAAKQLGLVEVAFTENKYDSLLIARDQDDLRVDIKVAEANHRQTRISIRWGKGGDRNRSIQFYYTVEKILAAK